MPAKKASISINLLADASKAKAGFAEAEKAAGGLDKQFGNLAKTAVNAFATREIINFGRGAVNAASDLAESANAVDVAFGDAADRILQLGENASTAVGLSATDFNQFAVQFSGFAKQLTTNEKDIVDVTEEISGRVADFASVMNLEVPDAASKFQSALSGSAEVLRPYGIDVSDAAVKQQALADGIWDGVGNMTESEKVMGRYRAVMEQTSQMAGDFANTSDGLANQQRVLAAEMENAKATIGEALVPAMEAIMGAVSPVLEAFTALPKGLQQTLALVTAGAFGMKTFSNTLQGFGLSAKNAGKATRGLGLALGAATIAFNEFASARSEIEAAGDRLVGTLDAETKAVKDSTEADVRKLFMTDELGKAMEMMGLDVDEATAAVLGGEDAAYKFIDSMNEADESLVPFADGLKSLFDSEMRHVDAIRIVRREYRGMRGAMNDARAESKRLEIQTAGTAEETLRFMNRLDTEGVADFAHDLETTTSGMDDFAEATRGAVDIALDPLNEGIETATTRLDKLFGLLSDEDAVNKFTDDLSALGEELSNTAEGTEEYDRLMNDALQTVETLRDQHSSLSDAFLEGLVFEVQTGDLEYALELIGKVQDYLGQGFAPGFEGLEIPQSMADLQAGGYVPNGMVRSVVINNSFNVPAGTDPDEIAASVYNAADAGAFSSAVPMPTTTSSRN